MDLIRAVMAFDEVLDDAVKAGRLPTTADKIHAIRAAIAAYEADRTMRALLDASMREARNG